MTEKNEDAPDNGALRLTAMIAPVRRTMRRAGALSAVSSALWIGQAAAVAVLIGGLLTPGAAPFGSAALATIFVAIGLMRAALDYLVGQLTFAAADTVLHREREALVAREALRAADDPTRPAAARTATLAAEKLAAMAPYLTRYAPARSRVIILPLLILALSAWFSWAVAAVLLVAGPLIPVFMALVGMAAKEASERQMEELADMNVLLLERLTALADIRLLDAGTRSTARFHHAADTLRARTMEVLRIAFLSSTVLELFAALGVAMVAVYVGFSLLGAIGFGAYTTPLTPAEGIFLLLLAPDYFQPLRDLAAAWHDKAAATAVARELAQHDKEPPKPIAGLGHRAAPLAPSGPLRTTALSYRTPGNRLIRFPDLTLAPGRTLAVTGPSGTGKTTLLRLLAGLARAESGDIRLGDTPFDDDTADAWRAGLGWMPQQPRFVSGSLRHNLTLATGATDTPLADALHLAAADGIVATLPKGLNTVLGETGVGVSGGEARRLSLVRAALARPQLLLADEPTADLDEETAALVTDGLLRLARDGTALIVATHDPVLAARMDARVAIAPEAAS